MATRELCRFRLPRRGVAVLWEITRYCNLACLHCCTESSPAISRANDLSTDACISAIDEMLTFGVKEFYFSGGEPFARNDFIDIASSINGADVYVNTNGYYLTHTVAERLKDTALAGVTVSVDGATPGTHAAFRGRQTSWHKAIGAIRACLDTSLPLRVSHVVGIPNVHELEHFVASMHTLGVASIVVNTVFPVGRAGLHSELQLSSEAIATLAQRLEQLRDRYREEGLKIDFSLGPANHAGIPAACPAGVQLLYISCDGDVSGCSWLYKLDPRTHRGGNLHADTFDTIAYRLGVMNTELRQHDGCPLPHLRRDDILAAQP